MKTQPTDKATERPMGISVHIPDYDTSFTYGLKYGDLAAFDDGNLLDLSRRYALTDFVTVINGALSQLNRLEREHALLNAVAGAATACTVLSWTPEQEFTYKELKLALADLNTLRGKVGV